MPSAWFLSQGCDTSGACQSIISYDSHSSTLAAESLRLQPNVLSTPAHFLRTPCASCVLCLPSVYAVCIQELTDDRAVHMESSTSPLPATWYWTVKDYYRA